MHGGFPWIWRHGKPLPLRLILLSLCPEQHLKLVSMSTAMWIPLMLMCLCSGKRNFSQYIFLSFDPLSHLSNSTVQSAILTCFIQVIHRCNSWQVCLNYWNIHTVDDLWWLWAKDIANEIGAWAGKPYLTQLRGTEWVKSEILKAAMVVGHICDTTEEILNRL